MEGNNNLFDLVNQVQDAKRIADIEEGSIEFTVYSKIAIQKGPLKKEYFLRLHIEVNNKSKVITSSDTECYDIVTYINGLVVNIVQFYEALRNIGLNSYIKLFDDKEEDYDKLVIYEDCLRTNTALKQLYFDKGYAYYSVLTEKQKQNVKEGRVWCNEI